MLQARLRHLLIQWTRRTWMIIPLCLQLIQALMICLLPCSGRYLWLELDLPGEDWRNLWLKLDLPEED